MCCLSLSSDSPRPGRVLPPPGRLPGRPAGPGWMPARAPAWGGSYLRTQPSPPGVASTRCPACTAALQAQGRGASVCEDLTAVFTRVSTTRVWMSKALLSEAADPLGPHLLGVLRAEAPGVRLSPGQGAGEGSETRRRPRIEGKTQASRRKV